MECLVGAHPGGRVGNVLRPRNKPADEVERLGDGARDVVDRRRECLERCDRHAQSGAAGLGAHRRGHAHRRVRVLEPAEQPLRLTGKRVEAFEEVPPLAEVAGHIGGVDGAHQPVESLAQLADNVGGGLGALEERHAQDEQVAGEVAGVDGRDIHRPQWLERVDRVPVVEMAAEPLQSGHRGHRRRDAVLEALDRRVAEVVAVHVGEELQADVRWRGAPRDDPAGILLEVVGREVVAVGDHERVEEPPGLAGDAAQREAVIGRERLGHLLRRRNRHPPREERTRHPDRHERDEDDQARRSSERGDRDDGDRRKRRRTHRAEERAGRRARALLGVGGGLPLEQVLVGDIHAVERAGDRIDHEPRLMR